MWRNSKKGIVKSLKRPFLALLFVVAFGAFSFSFETLFTNVDPITVVVYRANSCTGIIQIGLVQGGTGGYRYQWYKQNASTPVTYTELVGETSQTLSVTPYGVPGIYKLRITDSSGSFIEPEYPISEPFPLEGTTIFSGLVCSDDPNSGTLILRFTNGLSPYTWTLTKTPSGPSQTGIVPGINLHVNSLTTGTYNLTWRDDFGCTGQKEIIIGSATPIVPQVSTTNVTCPGGSDGTATFNLSGGWGTPYAVKLVRVSGSVETTILNWTDLGTATSYIASNLSAGNYRIYYYDRIKNAPISTLYGYNVINPLLYPTCNKFQAFTITEPTPFNLNLTNSVAVCQGDTNGTISISPTGGTPVYQINFYSGHFSNLNAPDPAALIAIGAPRTGIASGQQVSATGLSAGLYSVLLTDANGCKKASNITIIENPRGQVNATADNAVCAGSQVNVAFATTNPGGVTSYSWTNTNAAIGLAASGTGNISFTSTNTTNVPIQGTVTVTPTYTANEVSCPGPADTFIITVNPKPVIQNYTPAICSGTAFTVSPANAGATIVPANTTYTWTISTNNSVTGQSAQATGQNSISQTLTNISNTVQTVTYTVTPTSGEAGNCVGADFQVVVTVNPKPRVANQTIEACSRAPISYTATHDTALAPNGNIVPANTQYTWIIKTDNNLITGQSVQATAQATFTQTLRNTTNSPETIVYTLTPISGTCAGTPFDLTVLVNPTPEIAAKIDAICSGGTFTVSPTDAGNGALDIVPAGTTYTWTVVDNGSVTGETANSTAAANISQQLINTSNSVQTVTYTVTPKSGAAGNCVGATFQVVVTVNPKPTIVAETVPACSNSPISYTATNGGSNTVPTNTKYTWTIKTNNTNITGQTAQPAEQNSFTQTLRNITNVQETIVYTLTPISGTCAGAPFDLTVQVNPTPEIVSEAIAVCSNAPISYSATQGSNGNIVPVNTQYTWTIKTDNANITGKSAQPIAQNTFVQTLRNTTNTPKDIVYTLTPKSDTCTGTPFDLTVTVNPTPEIAAKTAVICSEAPFTLAPSHGFVNSNATVDLVPAGTTYTWTVSANNNVTGESNEASPQVSISQTLTNTTNVVQTVTYTVTPTSGADGSCVGQPFQVVVTVNPKPAVNTAQTRVICSNAPLTYSVANGGGNIIPAGTRYTWTIQNDNADISGQSNQPISQPNFTQTLKNKTTAPQTIVYSITPISNNGACVGNAFDLTVTVNPTPEIAAKSTAICSGGIFSVSPSNGFLNSNNVVDIVPSNTTYIWTVLDNPLVTGETEETNFQANISQALTNTSNQVQTVIYSVTPRSGDAGNCFGTPFQVSVQVNPKPVIQNLPETVCSGSSFTISPANGNGNIVPANTTYTWTFVNNPNVTGEATGTAQPNFTQTLTNTTTSPQEVTYTVTPTSGDTGTCAGNPFTITVTVNPNILINNQPAVVICSQSAFTVQPVDGQNGDLVPNGMLYTWTVGTNANIEGASNQTTPQASISQILRNKTTSPQTITYTVTPIYGASCSGGTFTVAVTVNPSPEIENDTASICSGDAFTVTPEDGNGNIVPSGTRYSWTVEDNPNVSGENIGTLQPSISQFLTNTSNTIQTVRYTVTPTSGAAGSCVGQTFQVVVTVNPRPSIQAQTIDACSNSAISYTATHGSNGNIVPTNTQYTWTIKTDNANITGKSAQATAQATFTQTLRNTTNVQRTLVYTLTPISGTCAGTPFDLTVQVNPTPEIAAKTAEICSTDAFTVSPTNGFVNMVSASVDIVPTGTTYTWTAAPNNNVTGESSVSIAQTSISQQLTNTTNTVQTVVYTVTPRSGATGNCIGQSFQVRVQVNPKPLVQPITETVCSASPFTITPLNGNGNIVPSGTTYSWTFADNQSVTGEANGTAQSDFTQTLTNTTTTPQTVVYTVIPTSGDSGNCVGNSFTVTITVNPTPVIGDIISITCSNTSFLVTPQDGSGNIVPVGTTYTWTITANANVEGESNQITAQNSISQLLRNITNTAQTVEYQVTPRLGTCAGTPFRVTVTINPTPEIENTTAIICSGDPFTISPTNSVANGIGNIVPANTTYTWTVAPNANVTGQSNVSVAQNTISQTLTNISNTVQTVTYTITPTSGAAGSCVGQTFQVVVTVNPRPRVANQTIEACSNAPITYTASQGVNGNIVPANTRYTWIIKTDNNNITGQSAQATAQTSFTQTLRNTTNVQRILVYTLTPISGTCAGTPFDLTVQVNPTPEIAAKTAEICSTDAFTVSPTNGFVNMVSASVDIVPTGTTYTWTAAPNNNVSGESSVPTAQTSISQTLTNTTNTVQTVVYTVTPRSGATGNCIGQSFQVRVQVNPKPLVQPITETVCSASPFTITPLNGNGNIVPSGTTYSWTFADNQSVTGEANGTAQSDFTQTLTNTTTTPQTVVYTVIPTSGDSGNCVGNSFTVTIIVNPTPVISAKQLLICSGDTFNFTLTDGANGDKIPTGTKYTWMVVSHPNITGAVNQAVPQNSIAISQALINTGTTPEVVTYQVTPTSATGCAGISFNLVVTVKDPIVINGEPFSYNGFGISCFGANDGKIDINPTGGKLPTDPAGYTYSWTGPNGFTSTAQDIENLVPGTYTVIVNEGSGICTQTKTFVVTEPQPVVITETLSNYNGFEISCFGASDGNITLLVTGGTSTYTYLWTASLGGLIPTGMQTAANLTGVRAGTYSVKVLDSNGCEKIESYVLRQPAPVGISEVPISRRNVLCYGEATGNISVVGSGGVKAYTYTVTGTDYTGAAVTLTSGPTNLNLHSFSTLKAGQYVLTLTDLNGCQKSLLPITITQPLAPIQVTNLVLSNFNGFNIACFEDTNGSISHQVSGGTAPYRYAWTGPNGFTATSLNLTNLAAGTYQLTITDAVNCTLVQPYIIRGPEPIDVDAVKQNVLCGGELTGNIFIRSVTGGTGVYESLWIKDGVGEIKRSRSPEDLRNIGPGRYILLVTDQNFCEYIEVFDVTEPAVLVTTLTKKENNLCFGDAKGSIQINVTGGRSPYQYAWTGPGGYTSTNKDLTGLLSGTYQVLVTDALLCTSSLSVTITEPTEIIVTPTLTMVSCPDGKDGAISMTVTGGIPPYLYAWAGPAGFRSTTRDLSNLAAGTYALVITDGIGCKITRSFDITDPEPIVITPTISDFNGFEISCKGGSDGVIDLAITGGNGGYRIFWEGPGGYRSNSQKIEGLLPGTYNVTILDSKGCEAKANYFLVAPDELLITRDDIAITDVSCFDGRDGTLSVTIKKASVGPYRYELSGSSVTGFPLSESVLSNALSYQFTGIRAGSYTLRVSDANGCALSELSGLVVDQPDTALSLDLQKTDVKCYRANNGTIRVTPSGGTAPYSIRWNNLSTAFALQNLAPGSYTATVTDAKGCSTVINTTVAEAPVYDLQEVVKNISCFGKKDGSIQLNIIGGKAPIKFQWAHGPQEPTLNNLDKGVYSVVITDAGGCKIERQFVINEPQLLDISTTITDALDCDDPNTGAISTSAFGGTPPYTYTWSNGARSANLFNLAPGSYSLELVDAMGCRILRQYTVIRPKPVEVSVTQTSERICTPRGIKSNFKVIPSGGVAPYTIKWNRGTQSNGGLTMDTQELGFFIVTVTDARGCIQTKRLEIIETDPLIPQFDFSSASYDFSFENLVNFDVQFANSSIGKYKEVTWDFGDGGSSLDWEPIHRYAKAGTYRVELKLRDLEGCVVSFTKEIEITDVYFSIPNVFTPNDDSVNDHIFPKFLYIKDIHFLIMNKWGELLFESKDLESKGWDGKHKGEDAPIGNYVIRVRYTSLDGRVFDQSSVFYLGR